MKPVLTGISDVVIMDWEGDRRGRGRRRTDRNLPSLATVYRHHSISCFCQESTHAVPPPEQQNWTFPWNASS